jgi:hypothetical protein
MMNSCSKAPLTVISLVVASLHAPQAKAQALVKVPVIDATIVATFHAEGTQIYEFKPDPGKNPLEGRALSWHFREPIATLIVDGRSIGRHYAGPNWDHIDGSGVQGRVVASALGATSSDIPWLRIDVMDDRRNGILSDVTTIERINTKTDVGARIM